MSGDISGVLNPGNVILDCRANSMDDAIGFVGGRLMEIGAIAEPYIDGMRKREEVFSTYLGNGVALPHGVLESKEHIHRTAIVVAQYPAGRMERGHGPPGGRSGRGRRRSRGGAVATRGDPSGRGALRTAVAL